MTLGLAGLLYGAIGGLGLGVALDAVLLAGRRRPGCWPSLSGSPRPRPGTY
ncbi:MAG: hypothetical protein MZW92_75785 [Comamonadaceae bacterium]|nr:hypothetical protein [Comamonadaceae bacterium]